MVHLKYKLLLIFSIVLLSFIACAEAGSSVNETGIIDLRLRNLTYDYLTYTFEWRTNISANCTVYGNWSGSWAVNNTLWNVSANVWSNYSITFAAVDKNYLWGVNCSNGSDETILQRSNNYSFWVDGIPPILTNVKNYTNNLNTYIFSATSSEDGNCTLWGNWPNISWFMPNETKIVTANVPFNFTVLNFTGLKQDIGEYSTTNSTFNWGINCTDNYGSRNNSYGINVNYTFLVDTNPAGIYTLRNFTNNQVLYTFSAKSIEIGTCYLYTNWTGTWKPNQSITVAANVSFNFTNPITFGRTVDTMSFYYWKVNCTDRSGNSNITLNETFVVDGIAPSVSSIGNYSSDNATWLFSATQNETEPSWSPSSTCTLWGDWSGSWVANETKSLTSNRSFNFTPIQFTNRIARYNWTVNCSDTGGNVRWAVSNYTVAVNKDTLIPQVPKGVNASQNSPSFYQADLTWESVRWDVRGGVDDSELIYMVWRGTSAPTTNLSANNNTGFVNIMNVTTNSTTDGVTSTGTYYYIITTVDDAGNSNYSITNRTHNWASVDLIYTEPSSDSGSGGSGSGGSGDISTPTVAIVGTKQSHGWQTITPTTPVTMLITKADFAIKQVDIAVKEEVKDVSFTVTQLLEKPASVDELANSYKYFKLEGSNIPASSLDKSTLYFSVDKSWIASQKIDTNDVLMYKFIDGEWKALSTVKLNEEGTVVKYKAETTTFSYYAIGVKAAAPVVPETTPVEEPETAPSVSEQIVESMTKSYTWAWVLGGLVVIALLFKFFKGSNKKKRR
jgi:PGF-pre-PGF domain-containing protein